MRTKCPIFADEAVLEKAGVQMDAETGKPILPGEEGSSEEARPLGEEELKSMSAFQDFIDTLDLEDIGEGKSPETG